MKTQWVKALFGILCCNLWMSTPIFAQFISNNVYSIELQGITVYGALTANLLPQTTAIADNSGKLSFSLIGVPNNTQYNFLVTTIRDSAGTAVRRSLIPAPQPRATLSFGVSPVTENQTEAFIRAFADARTDDPLLAFFGFLLVRTSNITNAEIIQMATFCYRGIKGSDGTGRTDGFESGLRANGATDAQLVNLRTNLISEFTTLTALYKNSVDEYFTAGSAAELGKRGEAAAKIFEMLVNAAENAGIAGESLLLAFNRMGALVVPLMDQSLAAGTLRAATKAGIESTMTRGMEKLRADKFLAQYTGALRTLGASDADVLKYETAATTLISTMQEKFRQFELTVMRDEDVAKSAIDLFNQQMQQEMEAAFTQFMTDAQASNAEISEFRGELGTALGIPSAQLDTYLPTAMFQYYSAAGTQVNWPITMVVAGRWMISIISNGGSIAYNRQTDDAYPIPAMNTWKGVCSNPSFHDKYSCQAAGGSWTPGRTDYNAIFTGLRKDWAELLEMREDVEIAEFTKYEQWNALSSLSTVQQMMQQEEIIEDTFYETIFGDGSGSGGIAGRLSGTTNGATPLSDGVKKALVTVFLSPDF
ncbi:MAG: hypothetical protein NC924_00560 [Candidatus Omnitrophica bacterium]|nr:hypothetical protein [Candidatus Omnitrophota bacterium]